MSRTFRNKRPQLNLGSHLGHKQNKDGKVRDGTPTHYSPDCERHGACPHCLGNRTFSSRKREPVDSEMKTIDNLDENLKRMLKLAGVLLEDDASSESPNYFDDYTANKVREATNIGYGVFSEHGIQLSASFIDDDEMYRSGYGVTIGNCSGEVTFQHTFIYGIGDPRSPDYEEHEVDSDVAIEYVCCEYNRDTNMLSVSIALPNGKSFSNEIDGNSPSNHIRDLFVDVITTFKNWLDDNANKYVNGGKSSDSGIRAHWYQ